MILLDTNVVSEPLRIHPNPIISAWLNDQVLETLYLSAITVAELRYGIAIMPDGKKKRGMREDLEDHLLPLFAGRILPFDDDASKAFAHNLLPRRGNGRANRVRWYRLARFGNGFSNRR